MSSVVFEPHLLFGQCVGGRYQVFNTVRHEKVFSVMRAYDLEAESPLFLFAFPRGIFRDFPQARAQLRFQTEQLGGLSSPFLLNLLNAGETEDLFFCVEEHPRGRSLSEALRERRSQNHPFSDREALGIAWLLCRALEDVHASAVHGFLHPREIYLEDWPGGPIPFYPRMAHIGIRAMLRTVLRKPFEGLEEEAACYACPEFESYGPLGKQADVYGVGAVLYGMLTLRAPTGRFVRPSSVRPGLPMAIDSILLRALDEDPEERYAAPSDLARALEGLWVLGTCRQALEGAADRLPAEATPWEGAAVAAERGVPKRGSASVLSEGVRAAFLVLLTLLSLGLFCEAVMEAGSSGEQELTDARAFRRWESLFSDAGLDGTAGPIGSG